MAARNKPAGIRSLVYGIGKGKGCIEGLSVLGPDPSVDTPKAASPPPLRRKVTKVATMPTAYKFNLLGLNFSIDTQNDFYGLKYWEDFGNLKYEPDTIALVYSLTGPEVHFMDLGAANGAMTLLAMLNGAQVTSFEPNPLMFSVLGANTRLNPGQVKIKNSAVSDQAKDMEYQPGADRKILSNIVFGSPQNNSTNVNVLSLSNEINGLDLGAKTRLVIKMDIEGAEWKILKDRKTLQTLGEVRAELILALHPGFYRPMTQSHWTKFIQLQIFRLMNFRDAWGLYKNLSQHSEIKRTNLNNVPTALHFSMLVMSGCHEFLVEFKSNSLPTS